MALYKNFYKEIPSSIKIEAPVPIDLRQVVATKDDLYAEDSWMRGLVSIAYNGMLVSIQETNELFMCINKDEPTEHTSWRKLNPDLDISGYMVTIVYYDGQEAQGPGYYEDTDGEGDPWVPYPDALVITDPAVNEPGLYLKLIFGQDTTLDVVYINSKNLISLEDYYTKEEINAKVDVINASIQELQQQTDSSLEELKDYVDSSLNDLRQDTKEAFDDLKNYIDSSLDDLREDTEEAIEDLKEYTDSSFNDLREDTEAALAALREYVDASIDTLHEEVEDISNRLSDGIVHSVNTSTHFVNIDPSQGHVKVNIEVIEAEDGNTFESTGLISDGYFEERMAWHVIS